MSQYTSWQPVKVIDQALESFGKAGTVRCASEYDGTGDNAGKKVVDVLVDGDPSNELTVFTVDQVAPL